jgi:NADH-quinone oxidoreductase subunit L
MYNLAWAVVLVPLGACIFSYLPESPRRAAHVCILGTGASLLLAIVVLGYRLGHNTTPYQSVITFFTFSPNQDLGGGVVGDFHPQVGIRVDGLSAVVLPVVALISLLVQVHSLGSMRGDPGLRRYSALLSLATFAMLGFVASPNYFHLYVMWELVAVCSWLLVGHWFHRPEALRAVRKAFLITRVGDVALLLAVVFGFVKFGANVALLPPTPGQDVNDPFSFTILGSGTTGGEWHRAHLGAVAGVGVRSLVVLAVLLLIAAVAKSAQLPLQSWLADTTEGPVPVVALVQSAGVAAMGVYLVARSYPLFLEVPQVLAALAVVGAATAVAGAVVALAHTDMQRIIAHLTSSHLGLALVALGVGAFSGGVFHLFTRMFTVALLVLAAGNVVRVYGTRDIRQMGGVWRRMPWTSLGMLAGCASSAGVLLLSGFWSEDAVLAGVLRNRLPSGGGAPGVVQALLVLAVLAALALGALAAFRLFVVAFLGDPQRRRGFQTERVREVGDSMRLPVGVLAALAAVVGLTGIQGVRASFGNIVFQGGAPQHEPFSATAFLLTALLGLGGSGAAWLLWVRRDEAAAGVAARFAGPAGLLAGAAALEPLRARAVEWLVLRPSRVPSWLDDNAVEPVVDAVGEGVELAGATARRLQTGRLSGYRLTVVAGTALLALGVTLAATGHLPGVGASR